MTLISECCSIPKVLIEHWKISSSDEGSLRTAWAAMYIS